MSNDTPRTNAAIVEEDTGYNGIVQTVSPDFARELERENAKLREALAAMVRHTPASVSPAVKEARDYAKGILA
jgi:hypothetical protein